MSTCTSITLDYIDLCNRTEIAAMYMFKDADDEEVAINHQPIAAVTPTDNRGPHYRHHLVAPPPPTVQPSGVVPVQQQQEPIERCDTMNNLLAECASEPILIGPKMCGNAQMIRCTIDDQQHAHQSPAASRANDTSHVVMPTADTSIRPPPPIRPLSAGCCSPAVVDSNVSHMPPPVLVASGGHALSCSASIICRICHNTDRVDRLISPCMCKGTLGYVHRYCLEYWLSRSGMMHCELCMFQYQTESTLRYNCCESARIWFRHPNNRGLLQSDLMVCSLLTIVTFGLVSMSLAGLQYFMLQGNRLGFSRLWTQGSLVTFLVIIIAAYCVNMILIVRAQLCPWYRWWQSVRIIRVVLNNYRPTNQTSVVTPSVEVQLQEVVLSNPVPPQSTDV